MKNMKIITGIFILAFLLTNYQVSNGCTNFLITRGASVDGSTMITYAADAHSSVW
jgi:hypothetical protein